MKNGVKLGLPYLKRQIPIQHFQFVLVTTNPLQNSITITEKSITELLHNWLEAIKYKGMFFSPNPDYSNFSEDLMIRFSESVELLGIRAILKIVSGHKF